MSPVAAEFKATYLGREERLPRQLKLLMVLRVILVFLLLGVTTYLQSRQKSEFIDVPLKILYVLCGASFVLTIFYSLALGKGVHPRKLAYLQVIGDVAFINVLMFITNGYDVFTFLYVVNIVSGSILLRRRGALVISLLSALSYALLIDLQYFSILPVVSGRELPVASLDELVNNIFWNTGAFLGVAFLSG